MLIRTFKILLTSLISATGLLSCISYTSQEATNTPMPSEWSVRVEAGPDSCMPLGDEYFTKGIGTGFQNSELVPRRLDADLGHTYPASNLPEVARLSTDEDAGTLTMSFPHPVRKTFTESVVCDEGWWKFEQKMSDIHMGDGGQLDELINTVWLATSTDGSLIVHVKVFVIDSSLVLVKRRENKEGWAKYESATGR